MPEIDLDFGGVGALPEEGVYRITIDKPAIYKQNKTKDGYIINLQMSLTDMPDEAFEGMKVFDNPSLKLSARWKLQEVLEAFTQEEWKDDGLKITVNEDNEVEDLPVGTTALGLVYHDDYNGRLQAKVRNYFPDNGTVEIGPSVAS